MVTNMVPYFKKFPEVEFTIDDKRMVMTDITVSFLMKKFRIDDAFLIQKYIIQGKETPESVSEKFYQSPDYYWVILFVNNIVDPYTEWLMDYWEIELLCSKKYDDPNGIHHFFDTGIQRVCDDYHDALFRETPGLAGSEIQVVTNMEHEIAENEKRREILLINPIAINRFISEFNENMEKRS